MGKKRPSIRTLPSGEKVLNTPDGSDTLVPTNRMLNVVSNTAIEQRAADAERQDKLLQAIADKQSSLDAGDAVPHDKRSV